MVEYRPLPDSALDAYRTALSYAFNPTGDRFDPEEDEELPPTMQVGERRGLFDGDELVSVCAHHFFNSRVRGGWHSMGGLSAVATPPEHRRHGHVRSLLAETLQEYRDREAYFASLWAFSEPFYAKFGWATTNRYVIQEGPPSALAFAREHESGSFFEAEKADWEALNDVLLSHGAQYQLTVDRTEDWWHNRIFHSWRSDPYVYGWRSETGSVEGYVVFTIEETDESTSQMQVWDMAFTTPDARLNLLRLLSNHEGQIDSVKITGPEDALLIDIMDDPSTLTYTVKPGPMIRLVDVPAALESLSYPETLEGRVNIEVSDPLADWNESTVAVEFEDGSATVTETADIPDLSLDIGSLSQLVVGYRPIERLDREGVVDVHGGTVADLLSQAFPEQSVFLRENF